MMSGRRQNTNNKRRGGRRFRRSRGLGPNQIKSKLNGRVMKNPSWDPPSLVENPWNTIVIPYESNGSAALTTANIREDILGILGMSLNTNVYFDLRVLSARIWETTGNYGIVAEFNNFQVGITAALYSPLATVNDNPAKNHWAVVGYEWPSSIQTYVVNSASDVEVLNVSSEEEAQILMHVRVLWKTNTEVDTRSFSRFRTKVLKGSSVGIQEEGEVYLPEE